MRPTRRLIVLAGALLVVARGARAGTDAQPAAMVGDRQPGPEALVKEGDRASARGDWEGAAHAFGEAAKAAPHDARLRERLRRALDRRARAREARAANPPALPPPGMSDGPQESATVLMFKSGRWNAQLKREALEARADAEAARTTPDDARIARLRRAAAKQRTQEQLLTVLINRAQQKDGADKIEMEKAFDGMGGVQGIGGVDSEMKDGVLHAR
jgi:hypothetical protein